MVLYDEDTETLREALIDLEQLREHEAKSRQDNELLLQGLRSLSYAQTPEKMFDCLFSLLRERIGCEDVFLLRITEDASGVEVLFATSPIFKNDAWISEALFKRVVAGNVIASFDVSKIPEWQAQPETVSQCVRSALHGPLIADGRPGILIATSPERGHFAPSHIEVMQRMLLLVEQALHQVEIRESLARERKLMVHRDQLQQIVDERTADLNEAKQAAVDASQSKSRLVAGLTHELRTPLHAIISFSELAVKKQKTISLDVQRYLANINRSGKVLLNLVDQLLDLAKMEAGHMKYDFCAVDIREQVIQVVDELESLAQKKKVKLIVELEPTIVEIDKDRIKQLMRNLLSNGLKFSPFDSEIRVWQQQIDDQIIIIVDDCGFGISDDDKQRVFQSFVQTETAKQVGGTGLGLAICREIAQAHKGRIWVEDEASGGASFRLSLPLAMVNKPLEELIC